VIQFDRTQRMFAARLQPLSAADPAVVSRKDQAEAEQAARRLVVGITIDGALQGVDRRPVVFPVEPPDMGLRARHELPGAEIVRRAGECADAFGGQNERLDRGDDVARDFVLDCEDVAKLAIILFGPVMQPVRGFNQLGADAQLLSRAPNAAAQEKPRIIGTWRLTTTKYGADKEHSPYGGASMRTKIINPTHFVWLEVETASKKILSAAGGKYSLAGNTYTETIDFAGSGMEEYVGKPQKFTVRVEGDKLTQSGELSDGLKIEEVWERVK